MSQSQKAQSNKTLSLLTIVEDSPRAFMYENLAQEVGINIFHSEGALHALTQLERIAVGAVICDHQMADMTGAEFRSVVEEETEGNVPVFVLPSPDDFTSSGILKSDDKYGTELLKDVLMALGISEDDFPVPMNSNAKAQLTGDLDQFALPDLLNWVAEMRFNGHWLIDVHQHPDEGHQSRSQGCHMVMEDGRVRYAEFAGQTGKVAMFTLLRAIEEHPKTTFEFFKVKDSVKVSSGDLNQTTQRLLMELAVDMDHEQHSHLQKN